MGSLTRSLRQRLVLRTVRGYQGIGRRVWTAGESEADEWLVFDVSVERAHCQIDAEQSVDWARPSTPVIAALKEYCLAIRDAADGVRTATWQNNDLSFVSLTKVEGHFIVESMVVSRGSLPKEDMAKQAIQEVVTAVSSGTYRPGLCLGRWASVTWSLLFELPWAFLFILIPGMAASLAPDPVFPMTLAVGGIAWIYHGTRRSARNRYNLLLSVWSTACRQGDLDGTLARALAAAGHPADPAAH